MKEFEIELLVRLKGTDLVASTAKNTLQHDLGYGDILEGLSREDHWLIKLRAEDEDKAQGLAEELATKTRLFVNPNKHTYKIGRRDEGEGREPKKGVYEVWVLVNYFEDREGDLARQTLGSTYGYENIIEIKRGTLWKMYIRAKSEEEARTLAEEMVLTRSVSQGLLVNPHSQKFKIQLTIHQNLICKKVLE